MKYEEWQKQMQDIVESKNEFIVPKEIMESVLDYILSYGPGMTDDIEEYLLSQKKED